MRRRRRLREGEAETPERLRRYRPEEWGHDPEAFWAARDAWFEVHPGMPTVDLVVDAPDVPFDPADI